MPWNETMPDEQFDFMREVLAAPSPVGLEGAMTHGVLLPYFEKWKLQGWEAHRFQGNAGLVYDTHPGRDDMFTVLLIGHADKIRMQVRSIGEDGKIWINSDSFLPTTLIGHQVTLFSEHPEQPGHYRAIKGGTIEALGAIHFASPEVRAGKKGIKAEQLYLELHMHGSKRKKQVERLGIRAGDSLLIDRPIQRGFSPDTFYGAYLDNGLGCFVTAEVTRLIAERGGLKNVRLLGGIATHEEIGRMGSRVMAGVFKPDVVIGIDVSHDFNSAPGVKDKRYTPNAMGEGMTLAVGAIVSETLNSLYETVCLEHDIPLQRKVVGRDTGTDAMAAVFASIDAAATSIGFPIRNMHTISESGHTGDVLASIHATAKLLEHMDQMNDGAGISSEDFKAGHPRLDQAAPLSYIHEG